MNIPDPTVPTTPPPGTLSALTASADGRASSPATPVALSLSDLTAFADAIVSKAIAKLEAARPATVEEVIHSGPLTIDLLGHDVVVDGRPINLKPREFGLLAALAGNLGRVLSRGQLLRLAWPLSLCESVSERTVDVHIRRLRLKLGEAADLIRTVGGSGYKLARLAITRRHQP